MGQGALFSAYFLDQGIAEMRDWPSIDDAQLAKISQEIAALLEDFNSRHDPNEPDTEKDLVEKVFSILGWDASLKQQTANPKGRNDVPDYLLFPDEDTKAESAQLTSSAERYKSGWAIVEGKAWKIALDASEPGGKGAPSTQLLRYLGTVDVQSEGAIRFGILTNGRVWRLYDHKARSRLEGYVEFDLMEAAGLTVPADIAEPPPEDHSDRILRRFLFLFGRDAFAPDPGGATRLTRAIAESRNFEARVTEALADTVFGDVFPELANALAQADPQRPDDAGPKYLGELREAALTWLYRLLFVLYAEDRSLLPTRRRRDGLHAMRREVARAIDQNEGLSERRTNHDGDLRDLWRQIDEGDAAIGLPPYNGGLFRAARSPLLERAVMADAAFAPLLDALSRVQFDERPRLINYRDLDVQHLGSVYERLLEYDLAEDDGQIVKKPQTFARKTSGSYYTPEELVMLVIRRTIGPLLDERREAFGNAAEKEARSTQAKDAPEYPLARLQELDPAEAFLKLRICDPAMGSGHFLVSLVDYLADQTMLATRLAAERVEFGEYTSPLLTRLERIRTRIRKNAAEHGWTIDETQLADKQLVRRIILKRVIYGVDKNPMAVELAKLSLWLHTFTVGAPLSFLDHHLRCGDSLFGEWVRPAMDRLGEKNPLFANEVVSDIERAVRGMNTIEDLTDADIEEVHQSRDAYADIAERIAPHQRTLSLLQGYRWIRDSWLDARKQAKKIEQQEARITDDPDEALRLQRLAWDLRRKGNALELLLEGQLGDPEAVLDQCYGRIGESRSELRETDPALEPLVRAAEISHISNFLHWELAFPKVWSDLTSNEPRGGFDAIIGNPPWDRLKMQEVEWFASRALEIAKAPRAADRKKMIRKLKEDDDPLADEYERAADMAKLAAKVATRKTELGGQYPLLGRGDVNLYSLFVERAQRLVNPRGMVGLLVPSGIAADLSASEFFRSISNHGRLSSLLDYANRPVSGGRLFFEDVDSRFKFCALAFGGKNRAFDSADCGFFLRSTSDEVLREATFTLSPEDFAAVNPNSGTAPIFRTPRDAELTTAIYARVPVLLKKSGEDESVVYPFAYSTTLHMANDSEQFLTAGELDELGAYPVDGGTWRRGEAEYLPLYEGKMVQAYNHRAASIVINDENLFRPGQPEPAKPDELRNPDWLPRPRYYVENRGELALWAIGLKDITASTNVRTVIAALIPSRAAGHTLPLLIADQSTSLLLQANLNSIPLDYVARQKVQTNHLTLYTLEQLPVIPPDEYDRQFGAMTAREIVEREVLHLTYTAHDMAGFARDMGHVDGDGEVLPPFAWDEADRRQRRARLDALYFHLYGICREDAEYILSTFPIVRRHDEAEHGRYLTRDLILGHMAALDSGDTDAVIVPR